jgi:hypothetical protein
VSRFGRNDDLLWEERTTDQGQKRVDLRAGVP